MAIALKAILDRLECRHTWKSLAIIRCGANRLFNRRFWYDCIFSTLGSRLVGFRHNVISHAQWNTHFDCVGDNSFNKMAVGAAFKTAIGMSLVSMVSIDAVFITDVALTGGAMLTWWVIPLMLQPVLSRPYPQLLASKALGKACH